MDDKRFDDIIKKKLESFKTDFDPESWDALSSKMEMDPDLGSVAEDIRFDEAIKDKVSSYETSYDPQSWDVLSAKMEINALEKDVEDQVFDETVHSKLYNHSIPLVDDSWQILKERLDHEAYLRTQLYIAKATEVFIIFLLLFTVYRLVPIKNIQAKTDIEFVNVELEKDLNPNSSELNDTPELEKNQLLNSNTLLAELSSPQESITETNLTNTSSSASQIQTNSNYQTNTISVSVVNQGPLLELGKINSKIESPTHTELIAEKLTSQVFNSKVAVSDAEQPPVNDHVMFASLNELATIEGGGVAYESTILNKDAFTIDLPEKKKTKLWLNGFISADAMLINTPYDPVYNAPAFNKAAAGFSGGVSVSVQKGSIELDAGLSYASKGYQPQIIRELNGSIEANYVERSLTNIIFDMAQANFNIKHHFFKNKKLQLYIMAGSSFNLITYSEYGFEEKQRSGNGVPLLTPIQTKLLDQKVFEKGALEGGDLISNSYFTLNAGFGIQHNFSNKMALFFQPNYQRHILDGGIGPNNDRIHNLSLQVGAKIRLN